MRHLVRVCLRFNWQCFGDHFLWLFCKISKKVFFYRPVNANKPNFVSFLVFVGAAVSSTAKISSFETVSKREAILNPVLKQWISKDIPSYGSQSERTKIAIHWFGEYLELLSLMLPSIWYQVLMKILYINLCLHNLRSRKKLPQKTIYGRYLNDLICQLEAFISFICDSVRH